MRIVLALVALTSTTAWAGPISKFDSRPIAYKALLGAKLEDVERCLIDVGKMGLANVFRQPDRPDHVTLTWSSGAGVATARVDLDRDQDGTRITSWLERKDLLPCTQTERSQ